MKKTAIVFIILVLLSSGLDFASSQPTTLNNESDASILDNPQEQHILQNINNFDGYFTENCGQVGDDSVRYCIQGKGVWFLEDGVVFEILEELKVESRESGGRESEELPFYRNPEIEDLELRKSFVLKLTFEDPNHVTPEGRGLLRHHSNFFYGNIPSKWCTKVPNFNEIYYENIYDDIDLRYYFSANGLKYEFIVQPGGDPSDIVLKYEGMQELILDSNGDLIIKTSLGNIVDSELTIFQNMNDNRNEIAGQFVILDTDTYGFEIIDKYDHDQPLIIDPLLYSTYIGGSESDNGWQIEIDTSGNAYVVGYTPSSNFPTTPGAMNATPNGGSDIYFVKLDPTGSTLLYSTFIGGIGTDRANGFIMDASCNSYLAGYTYSSDFPITAGAYNSTYNSGNTDAFVLKLSSSGTTILYSTYVGGDSLDYGNGIDIDSNLDIYVTGETASTNFPTTSTAFAQSNAGSRDAFVLKLNPAGMGVSDLVYSTYIGDTFNECGNSIDVDSSGVAYVVGETASYVFPTTPNAYDTDYNSVPPGIDTFVLKLNQTGSSLQYSTYIGGGHNDYGYSIAIDSNGYACVSGYTGDNTFPNTTGAYDPTFNNGWDCFIFKLNPAGTGTNDLVFSTFIGEFSNDYSGHIVLDVNDNIYMAGSTNSINFPNTTGAYDITYNDGTDGFIIKLDSTGSSLLYSTFIGGSESDRCNDLVLDTGGNIYTTGRTYSSDFPTSPTANDTSHNGNYDAFVLKLSLSLNFPPIVIDLQAAQAVTPRTCPVYLNSNATDPEDLEQNLTPYFEYRDPNEQVWNCTNQSKIQYNNSRWEISYIPSKNATLGLYDFRVKFNDTSYLFSPWLYFNDSVKVVNNFPVVEDLSFSNNSALLQDTITIFVNGTDIEETEENLTITIEYRDPNDQFWNATYLDNPEFNNARWKCNFTVPIGALFGNYDIRARFQDADGNYSKWLYANDSLLVYNTPPRTIDLGLAKSSIHRTESVFLYANGTDYETSEDLLTLSAQYKHNDDSVWSDLSSGYSPANANWEAEFITIKNSVIGIYDFRTRFDDNEGGVSSREYLNDSLEVLNNVPKLENSQISNSVVYRTNTLIINSNATDVESQENLLVCDIQYRPPSGTWTELEDIEYYSDYWRASFTTQQDTELGLYDLRIDFTDPDDDNCGWTELESAFEVRNNLPTISELCDDFEVGAATVELNLTQFGADIEDADSDLEWSIDIMTVNTALLTVDIIGDWNNILQIEPVEDTAGIDDIRLYLKDKNDGLATKADVTIVVDSRITAQTPKVTLVSPVDRAILGTLTPRFEWNLEYEGADVITYSLSLDQNPDPSTEIVTGLTSTSFTLPNALEDDTTYYWKVTPSKGICLSEPFRFTINLGFEPEYQVNLTTEKDRLLIKQGASAEINFNVKNDGNTIDTFQIEYSSAKLQTHIDIDKPDIKLESGIETSLKLSIAIPVDFELGEYSITVTATSVSDETANDEVNIIVNVVDKDFEPDYDVEVDFSPYSIETEEGETETITLTIINIGNIEDDYTISFESDEFDSTDITFSKNTTTLEAGDDDQIIITITIPANMEPGDYTIEFIIESDTVLDSTLYDIEVKDEGGDGKSGEDSTLLYASIGIIVIIVIVILILAFLFVIKKKPPKEEQLKMEASRVQPMQPSTQATAPPPVVVPTQVQQVTSPPPQVTPPAPQPPRQTPYYPSLQPQPVVTSTITPKIMPKMVQPQAVKESSVEEELEE